MNCFLLLASMFIGIAGIAMPPTRSSDSLLPRNVGPGSQFSSRAAEIFLDEEGLDGSLWLDTENIVDVASDPLFFAENSDISFPPIVFDEASAAACDDTQSSLDPITEIYGLNARDLIDEFTSLQDSKCCAFTGTGPSNPDPQKPVPDTDTQKPKPDTDPSLGTSIEQQPQLIRAPAGCPLDYHYALCCAGPIAGINVMGCVFFMASLICPPDGQYCCRNYDFREVLGNECVRMDCNTQTGVGLEPTNGWSSWFGYPGYLGD